MRTWAAVLVSGTLLIGTLLIGVIRHQATPIIACIPEVGVGQISASEHAGVVLAAKQIGIGTYWNAPDREDDVQRQISLVEKVISGHYAGLILAPTQALALMTPAKRALEKGLPVVVIDTALPIAAGKHLSYIVNDEEETGRLAASRVGDLLHGDGRVSIFGIDANSVKKMTRLRSFESTLHQHYPRIIIADRRPGSMDDTSSQQIARESLRDAPHVGVVLSLDTTTTLGVYRALSSQPPDSRAKIVGCDLEWSLLSLLRNGGIDSLIVANTFAMGYEALQRVDDLRRGRPVPPYTTLQPIVVTRENVDEPAIQRRFVGTWRTIR